MAGRRIVGLANDGNKEGWINRRRRRPRVFLSYRHTEAEDGEDAARINAEHKAWVEKFAADLGAFEIDVVWDKLMQNALRKRSEVDPERLPFSAEISRICPMICHAFVPVLTPRYLERIGIFEGVQQKTMAFGGAHEEWLGAIYQVSERTMDIQAVVRSGQEEDFAPLPYLIKRPGLMDMRPGNEAHYEKSIQHIAGRLHYERKHDDPPVDMELEPWIDLYLDWCRLRYKGCAAMPVGAWPWRTDRPMEFFSEYANAQQALGAAGNARSHSALMQHFTGQNKSPEEHSWIADLSHGMLAFGDNGEGAEHLTVLVDACRAALSEGKIAETGTDYGKLQHNLARAMLFLGRANRGDVWLPRAVTGFKTAIDYFDRVAEPLDWSRVMTGLGEALAELGKQQTGTGEIELALEIFDATLSERPKDDVGGLWVQTAACRAEILLLLGARRNDTTLVKDALRSATKVIAELEKIEEPDSFQMFRRLWTPEAGISHMRTVIAEGNRLLEQAS